MSILVMTVFFCSRIHLLPHYGFIHFLTKHVIGWILLFISSGSANFLIYNAVALIALGGWGDKTRIVKLHTQIHINTIFKDK